MSSVLASFEQVPSRGGMLLATASTAIATVDAGFSVEYLMSEAEFTAATSAGTPVTSGNLLRDLGKVVTVYNAVTNLAVVRYAKVLVVNGPASEGVAASPVVGYVKVWSAAGTGVTVARV
jgi:hypothetical protein